MGGELKGSPRITRRSMIGGMTAGALAPAVLRAAKPGSAAHVAVVGAGVFGSWSAEHLRRAGHRVTLVDMAGPAQSRASSGGESRMTRGGYGKDEIYTRMAFASLPEWKKLSEASGLPIFIPSGVLFFSSQPGEYFDGSIEVHSDARVYAGVFERGQRAELALAAARHAWVHVARGTVRVNGHELAAGDGLALTDERALIVEGTDHGEVLVFDLAA